MTTPCIYSKPPTPAMAELLAQLGVSPRELCHAPAVIVCAEHHDSGRTTRRPLCSEHAHSYLDGSLLVPAGENGTGSTLTFSPLLA